MRDSPSRPSGIANGVDPGNLRLLRRERAVARVAELDELYQLQAACHEAQIQLLTEQITTLERALYPYLIPNDDVQRLRWIPGLGKVNAFTLYTEIDGIARFPSARQFFSYSRLVPGAANSGGRTGLLRPLDR